MRVAQPLPAASILVAISVFSFVQAKTRLDDQAAPKLKSYNVDANAITVSGISAGAFFAVQMQIAFSSTINGAAIVAGGPYYCAEGQMTSALTSCMSTGLIDMNGILKYIKAQEKAQTIDDTANLSKHKVLMWSGTKDHTVSQSVMKSLEYMYQTGLGVNETSVYFNYSSGHAWITDYYGNSCGATASPYINNCDFDLAGESFKMFYGPDLKDRASEMIDENLLAFDQLEFGGGAVASLGNAGYIYVPTACGDGSVACALHVNFHGCNQGAYKLGQTYVQHSGLNRWAETNNIIVVYPQAASALLKENPNGCFDWWGYNDAKYATQEGMQMRVMKKIIDRVSGVSSFSLSFA